MAKGNDVSYKKIKKLEATFKALGGDKMTIGLSLIKEAHFMAETLTRLRNTLNDEDLIENFQQGAQSFLREHPALKSYQSIMKQLIDMLPDNSKKMGESLSRFLSE